MIGLTEFLVARVAEDEERARKGDWNPTRMLAECESKRLVMVWHQQYNTVGCGEGYHGREDQCPTMRALALPYVDHKDFRKEWLD